MLEVGERLKRAGWSGLGSVISSWLARSQKNGLLYSAVLMSKSCLESLRFLRRLEIKEMTRKKRENQESSKELKNDHNNKDGNEYVRNRD